MGLAALEAADFSQSQDLPEAAAAAAVAGPAGAEEIRRAAAAAAQPGFDVDAELDRLGAAEKQLKQSARRKVLCSSLKLDLKNFQALQTRPIFQVERPAGTG